MTDSEIINLLGDYKIPEKEIPTILKSLKARDFEHVLQFIDTYVNTHGAAEERERLMKEAMERNEQMKKEAEYNERYESLLKEKIEANRYEQKQREAVENRELKKSTSPETINNDKVTVKIIVNDNDQYILGFKNDPTFNELFERIKDQIGVSSFTLTNFGDDNVISSDDKKLYETTKARLIMLDVKYSTKKQ